jgi:hypothetical protein
MDLIGIAQVSDLASRKQIAIYMQFSQSLAHGN